MFPQQVSAFRTAICGFLGFLFAQVTASAVVMTMKLATDGSLFALLFLLPAFASFVITWFALRETARGIRSVI